MKLLIATGLYPPEIGGPATYAKLFEERLPRYGIEVSIFPFRTVRHLPPLIRHIVYGWKVFRMSRNADLILVQDSVSTGLPVADESRLFRFTLRHSVILASVVGLVALGFAYVAPGLVPKAGP